MNYVLERRKAWWFPCFLLFVFFVAVLFAGCAATKEIPLCEKFQYIPHQQEGRLYYVLDEANAVVLVALVEGLSKGTCRLEE